MEVKLEGVAFSAYNKDTRSFDKKESFNRYLDSSNKYIYKTKNTDKNYSTVKFTDPHTKMFVSVSLKTSTIEKIKEYFDESSFKTNKDNSIQLTGQAEKFVSNWYADIAYNRNFLSADKNNDTLIDKNEYENTYNDFSIEGLMILNIKEPVNKSDILLVAERIAYNYLQSTNDENLETYRKGNSPLSLDDELDHTINLDKDFNGEITLKEYYTKDNKSIENIIMEHISEYEPINLEEENIDKLIELSLYISKLIAKMLKDKIILELINKSQAAKEADFLKLDKSHTKGILSGDGINQFDKKHTNYEKSQKNLFDIKNLMEILTPVNIIEDIKKG